MVSFLLFVYLDHYSTNFSLVSTSTDILMREQHRQIKTKVSNLFPKGGSRG